MTKLLVVLTLIFSLNGFAQNLDGRAISPSFSNVTKLFAKDNSLNDLVIWKLETINGQVLTKLITKSGLEVDYTCNEDLNKESKLACIEDARIQTNMDYKKEASLTFNLLKEQFSLATTKLEKVLKRSKLDLSVLSSTKLWVDSHSHGHHHGSNIWIRFDYEIERVTRTSYVVCHQHGHNSPFVCHGGRPEDEPSVK